MLRNPRRELEIPGPKRVDTLLAELGVRRESVLVIRGDDLVTPDTVLADDDVVEIRPVISGGQVPVGGGGAGPGRAAP